MHRLKLKSKPPTTINSFSLLECHASSLPPQDKTSSLPPCVQTPRLFQLNTTEPDFKKGRGKLAEGETSESNASSGLQICLHCQALSLSLSSSSLGCMCLRERLKRANTLSRHFMAINSADTLVGVQMETGGNGN